MGLSDLLSKCSPLITGSLGVVGGVLLGNQLNEYIENNSVMPDAVKVVSAVALGYAGYKLASQLRNASQTPVTQEDIIDSLNNEWQPDYLIFRKLNGIYGVELPWRDRDFKGSVISRSKMYLMLGKLVEKDKITYREVSGKRKDYPGVDMRFRQYKLIPQKESSPNISRENKKID